MFMIIILPYMPECRNYGSLNTADRMLTYNRYVGCEHGIETIYFVLFLSDLLNFILWQKGCGNLGGAI